MQLIIWHFFVMKMGKLNIAVAFLVFGIILFQIILSKVIMLLLTLNNNGLNFDTNHTFTIHSTIKKKPPNIQNIPFRNSLDDHNPSLQRLKKTSQSRSTRQKVAYLSYPSLFKSKKASFQKFIQNRQKLKERGKQMNGVAKCQSFKMIAVHQRNSIYTIRQNQNWCDPFTQAQTIPIFLSKKQSKNKISCNGQSFRNSCDSSAQPPKLKRIRYNPSIRYSEPFDKYKRASTMPQFKQEVDINLSPWVAEAIDEGIMQRAECKQQI